ncbi:DUF4389 domain-containing protein [Trujillonella endophytica]|uniref:DUF4389 domain-containing protein n=1 Tax=Trujillonella endophytica TaxID=673521 RepID=A0A1H8SWY3_9ACTN|nr:DUF4389 domain-containing protein [Trujillella endophytica]SEO83499.1 protein of unknown function [Trujillella endophytica]
MTEYRKPYPVRVDASLDESLSRWLWLVKWLLLIPHYVVLTFLWLGFAVVGVIAFFAILITARYPRALFDYNVGVLRWTWRVHHYGYGALGTDRYPPFTLAEVPGHPAHLSVPYPERLSRGLVLVKWWLLALPHYVVLAVLVGGGIWLGAGSDGVWDDGWGFGGLVALLVFVAGVVLLFTGSYPRPIYDFVIGMDRWALRVAAYVSLMTDVYPPFRMDMGGTDPGSLPAGPDPAGPAGGGAAQPAGYPAVAPAAGPAGSAGATAAGSPQYPVPPQALQPSSSASSWPAGRVVTLVIGALLLVTATGVLGAGGTLLWADQTQREDGRLVSPDADLDSERYAVATDDLLLEGDGLDWVVDELLGTARLEVTPADDGDELFVGLGRTAEVARYLDGVGRSELDDLVIRRDGEDEVLRGLTDVPGGAPATPPAEADVWTVSASGSGTQVLDWRPTEGDWTVVVMRADGGAGIRAEVRAGAELPGLTWFSVALLGVGLVLGLAGGLLVGLAVHRARSLPPPAGWASGSAPPPPLPAGAAPPPPPPSAGPPAAPGSPSAGPPAAAGSPSAPAPGSPAVGPGSGGGADSPAYSGRTGPDT